MRCTCRRFATTRLAAHRTPRTDVRGYHLSSLCDFPRPIMLSGQASQATASNADSDQLSTTRRLCTRRSSIHSIAPDNHWLAFPLAQHVQYSDGSKSIGTERPRTPPATRRLPSCRRPHQPTRLKWLTQPQRLKCRWWLLYSFDGDGAVGA